MRRDTSMRALASELRQLQALLPTRTQRAAFQEPVKRALPLQVLCRFRGQSPVEADRGGEDAWDLAGGHVALKPEYAGAGTFPDLRFHHVHGPEATQVDVYDALRPVVQAVLQEQTNGCILCYGQTSAGKTHTMEGKTGAERGIIPRALETVFNALGPDETVTISMLEIYMERLRDLLGETDAELAIVEDSNKEIYVKGLREVRVASCQDALAVFGAGQTHRAVATTGMNERSSRSHSIFILKIGSQKLLLVDLAGSECMKKTLPSTGGGSQGTPNKANGAQNTSDIMEESKAINQSLLALGLVIKQLAEQRPGAYIPYRNSKLTRVLSDCLGSCSSRTALVVNCSMSCLHINESISTLRFGARAQSCVNIAPVGNKESALVRTLRCARLEIMRLQGLSCPETDITPISQVKFMGLGSPFDVPCRNLDSLLDISDQDDLQYPRRMSLGVPSPLDLSPARSRRVSLHRRQSLESPLDLEPPCASARASGRLSLDGKAVWPTSKEELLIEEEQEEEEEAAEVGSDLGAAHHMAEEIGFAMSGYSWEYPLTNEDKKQRYVFLWEEEAGHLYSEMEQLQKQVEQCAEECTTLKAENAWLAKERVQHLQVAVAAVADVSTAKAPTESLEDEDEEQRSGFGSSMAQWARVFMRVFAIAVMVVGLWSSLTEKPSHAQTLQGNIAPSFEVTELTDPTGLTEPHGSVLAEGAWPIIPALFGVLSRWHAL